MIDKNGIDLTQWRPIDSSEKLVEGDRAFHEYGFTEIDSSFIGKYPSARYDYYRKIPFISEYESASAPLPPARFSYRDWLIGQIASGCSSRPSCQLTGGDAAAIVKFADLLIQEKNKH